MLLRVFSDLASFKEITFKPGLNVLLADRSPGATERQTRNGSGKTSLIEVVHFLLGANSDPGSIFRSAALENYYFGLDFTLPSGAPLSVRRTGKQASRILIDSDSDNFQWNVKPVYSSDGVRFLSNTNWKRNLAYFYFGVEDEGEEPYSPSLRSLISYFVRREGQGGFNSPFKHANIQQLSDQQVSVEYLLGLDWTISRDWQRVRDREKALAEIRRAAGQGLLGEIIGTTATLRTELAVAERSLLALREQASTFQVLPRYRELESEASNLAREIGGLSDSNTVDRHLLAELQDSLQADATASDLPLQELFQEIGLQLPSQVVRTFDEVRAFHQSVVQNRESYLTGEIQAAQRRITERDLHKASLDGRRREIMLTLQSHGALDQLVRIQSELTIAQSKVEQLRHQFESAEQLESQRTELEIERNNLFLRLQQDFREQNQRLGSAIVAFEEVSSALYEEAGSLTIQESMNGPAFDVLIQGAKSKGIGNMQVFCFDMMLMKLRAETGQGPDFLVHDSHLFDGVDSRQTAHALEVGAAMAKELGFQYVVTMNSDMLPQSFSEGFKLEDYLLPVRLTDATDDGGLFGIRFG